MPVKIALVTHHVYKNDGQGRVNFELARYLAGRGHRVHLVAHGVDSDLSAVPGITAQVLPCRIHRPYIIKCAGFIKQAGRFLKENRFDIVHANGGVLTGDHHVNTSHFVHSWWSRSPFGSRREGAYLRLSTRFYAGLERRAYAAARLVVAVSNKVKRELVDHAGVDEEKIIVIYNGVDGEEFSPANRSGFRKKILDQWKIPPGRFVILFAGDLRNNRKGISSLIESLPYLDTDYHLVVLGGAEGSPFVRKAEDMGLEGRITWAGFRKEINAYMAAADAFVYPTRTDSFPSVVMEALSCGTPVVVSGERHCGVSELLRDGENALLLDNPWDQAGIAAGINSLARDAALRRKLSVHGRSLAEKMTWQRMARQYEQIYPGLAGRGECS